MAGRSSHSTEYAEPDGMGSDAYSYPSIRGLAAALPQAQRNQPRQRVAGEEDPPPSYQSSVVTVEDHVYNPSAPSYYEGPDDMIDYTYASADPAPDMSGNPSVAPPPIQRQTQIQAPPLPSRPNPVRPQQNQSTPPAIPPQKLHTQNHQSQTPHHPYPQNLQTQPLQQAYPQSQWAQAPPQYAHYPQHPQQQQQQWPMQQPQVRQQQPAGPAGKPWLVWSILNIFFCICLGIPALVLAMDVKTENKARQYQTARSKSTTVLILNIVGTTCCGLSVLTVLGITIPIVVATNSY